MLQALRKSGDFNSSLDPSRHISTLALSSTMGRLAAGLISDYISLPSRQFPVSRMPLFLLLVLFHVLALFLLSYAPISWLRSWFSIGSILIGMSYGGIFTLAPTIVSIVWGIGGFGRNWGILTCTPGISMPTNIILIIALGAIIFGLLYAYVYDLHSPSPPAVCNGRKCWQLTLVSAGWGGLIAMVIFLLVWQNWRKREWII